jgi:arsenate reductase
MRRLVPKLALTNCCAKTKIVLTIYGIPNCDKCRAAKKWFAAQNIAAEFHDLRVDGIDAATIKLWQEAVGDDVLINRRSTTWRALAATEREGLDSAGYRNLLLQNPTLLKRPIVTDGKTVLVGYDEAAWANL